MRLYQGEVKVKQEQINQLRLGSEQEKEILDMLEMAF